MKIPKNREIKIYKIGDCEVDFIWIILEKILLNLKNVNDEKNQKNSMDGVDIRIILPIVFLQ